MSAKADRAAAARAYLAKMGIDSEAAIADDGAVLYRFRCGCVVAPAQLAAVCERHRGALLGRDSATGAYGTL